MLSCHTLSTNIDPTYFPSVWLLPRFEKSNSENNQIKIYVSILNAFLYSHHIYFINFTLFCLPFRSVILQPYTYTFLLSYGKKGHIWNVSRIKILAKNFPSMKIVFFLKKKIFSFKTLIYGTKHIRIEKRKIT